MHTTVAQNKAHRASLTWIKTPGRTFRVDGETYISEYVNVGTGQAIRKSWRMTGRDWHIFDGDTRRPGGCHSLTIAKFCAENDK